MKKLFLALGMIIVSTAFFSCSKGSGSGGSVTPVAKINSYTAVPATINYSGTPTSGTITLSWNTSNGTSIMFDNTPVGAIDSKITPVLFESKTFTLSVTDAKGVVVQDSKTVVVNIDPTFEKMCGKTGQGWKFISKTAQPITGGSTIEFLQADDRDNIYTMYPNASWKVDYGAIAPGPTESSEFKFYPESMTMLQKEYSIQPTRVVSFPNSNTMVWKYSKNNFNIVETLIKE